MRDTRKRRVALSAFLRDIGEHVEVERAQFDGDELAQAILGEVLVKLRDCGVIAGIETALKTFSTGSALNQNRPRRISPDH